MSNMADTSLAAFKHVNVTAGQQRVLDFLRAHPKLKPTRQEIADLSGMKLQTVCARVNELLYDFEPPILRTLPAVEGKHPIELNELPPREARTDIGPISVEKHGEASGESPRNPQKKREPVYVQPYLPHRMSMSLAEARKCDSTEAQLVRKAGHAFRVWGEDLELCALVDRVVSA